MISIILSTIFSRSFFLLTFLGNSFVFSFAAFFYKWEGPHHPKINSYLDSLWYCFSTATTVGYGDITPITSLGKILGIFLMLVGTALFAMYTALFAEAIMEMNASLEE